MRKGAINNNMYITFHYQEPSTRDFAAKRREALGIDDQRAVRFSRAIYIDRSIKEYWLPGYNYHLIFALRQ